MERPPISVLHFSNSTARGGAEEHILTLLQGMDQRYFRLSLVCPPELVVKLRPSLPDYVSVVPLNLEKPTQVATALRLAQILRERKVDILHSHLFFSSLFASPVGWLSGVPVVVETPHVREQWRRGWKSHFVIDRVVGHFVDYYIAVSEANKRYLVEQKGLPEKKIVVVHNGCDLNRFDPRRRAPAGLKESLGFGQHDPVLVVIARLEPQKGHRVLLDALAIVRGTFPAARLVCVGEGALETELKEYTRALKLGDAVYFVGYQNDVTDWLALADVFVLPSFYEGLPLVAIEALAAGRPVIATAVDGTPEVVVDGKTGLTVPPGDASRLAQGICRVLTEPELRHRLAEAGRLWVLERFSRNQQILRTQEFYFNAWRQRKRGLKAGTEIRASGSVPETTAPSTEN